MDNLLLPTLPLTALLVALLLKRGAIVASIIGSLAVLAVIFYDGRYALDAGDLIARDLPIVLILTLSTALVIIPGQILNVLLRSAGTIEEIGARIESVRLSPVKMASVIVLGVAPALESMTGFGVSLFFTVPVLVHLFSLRKALLLSLLSMNIMPWGTLGLATLIGAQMSGIAFARLAAMTSWTSFAVFPVIGFLVFLICRERGAKSLSDWPCPVLSGFFLSCCLVFYNAHAAAELAGVCAGLTTAAAVLLFERVRGGRGLLADFVRARPSLPALFAPYLLLIALIALSRVAVVHETLRSFFSLENGNVKLFVFTSPGVFILLTAIFIFACSEKYRRHSHAFHHGVKRAVYPLAGIALFAVFAQLHRASGLFKDIASRMVGLQPSEITFISPLLGMLSGYATGSNVGGNVLFMSLQSETGEHFGRQLVFAALQNSGAGHAVFLSLPIILLTLSIAAAGDRDNAHAHQPWLVRRTLLCAPLIYAALVIPFHLLAT